MIYTAPTKGEDGLYFVKVLNDDKRKCLVQLNKVKVTDVSGDVAMDIVSDVTWKRPSRIVNHGLVRSCLKVSSRVPIHPHSTRVQ